MRLEALLSFISKKVLSKSLEEYSWNTTFLFSNFLCGFFLDFFKFCYSVVDEDVVP